MNRDLLCRAAGVGLILLGCALAYWSIYEPLHLAQTGAAEVSYQFKGVLIVPFGFVAGLAYLVGGEKIDPHLRQPGGQRPTVLGMVVTAAALGLGGLLYWWFSQQLTAMGYVEAAAR